MEPVPTQTAHNHLTAAIKEDVGVPIPDVHAQSDIESDINVSHLDNEFFDLPLMCSTPVNIAKLEEELTSHPDQVFVNSL